MPLTPEDVANKQFTSTRLKPGYDETEVDEFLDEVEAELTRLYRENDELKSKLAAAQRSLAEAGDGGRVTTDPADRRRRPPRPRRAAAEPPAAAPAPDARDRLSQQAPAAPAGQRRRPRARPASWRWRSAPPTSSSPRRRPRPTASSARRGSGPTRCGGRARTSTAS